MKLCADNLDYPHVRMLSLLKVVSHVKTDSWWKEMIDDKLAETLRSQECKMTIPQMTNLYNKIYEEILEKDSFQKINNAQCRHWIFELYNSKFLYKSVKEGTEYHSLSSEGVAALYNLSLIHI